MSREGIALGAVEGGFVWCICVATAAVCFIVVISSFKGCSKEESRQQVERNSKCFEQTQAKECWGLK